MKKLGYATLSTETLTPEVQCILGAVVNNCSDGNDVVKCFHTTPLSKFNATLDQEEVRAMIESVRVWQQLLKVTYILVKLRNF